MTATSAPARRSATRRAVGAAVLLALLVVLLVASLALGTRDMDLDRLIAAFAVDSPGQAWSFLTDSAALDGRSQDTIAVYDQRIPRTVLGLVVGFALGVAGALTQSYTRNPLADPGLLGVTAGASFAVVLGTFLAGLTAPGSQAWLAAVGAAVATAAVFAVSSLGRSAGGSVTLVLAGIAVSAFLVALTTAIVLRDAASLDQLRGWSSGSLAGRRIDVVAGVVPCILLGALAAAMCVPGLNAVGLGEDVARSLGVRLPVLRVGVVVAVALLAGGATAGAGPIAFVGLIVPHVARLLVGVDQRWVVSYSGLIGAVLVLLADVIGRLVARPGELSAGIVVAFVGAPVFIALVRRRQGGV